jgi:hypothetical protein
VTNRMTIAHQAKVHCRAYQLPIKGQIHPTHRE